MIHKRTRSEFTSEQVSNSMGKADAIFAAAFNMPRDPRSPEYKQGVLDALRFRLGEGSTVRCPYPPESAQSDAYFAGVDEGHRRAREQTRPADPSADVLKDTPLLADAHRYRWLRERNLDTITADGIFAGMTPQNIVLNGADLDRAIDSACAQEKGGTA